MKTLLRYMKPIELRKFLWNRTCIRTSMTSYCPESFITVHWQCPQNDGGDSPNISCLSEFKWNVSRNILKDKAFEKSRKVIAAKLMMDKLLFSPGSLWERAVFGDIDWVWLNWFDSEHMKQSIQDEWLSWLIRSLDILQEVNLKNLGGLNL